jgi:hypothetical protein
MKFHGRGLAVNHILRKRELRKQRWENNIRRLWQLQRYGERCKKLQYICTTISLTWFSKNFFYIHSYWTILCTYPTTTPMIVLAGNFRFSILFQNTWREN